MAKTSYNGIYYTTNLNAVDVPADSFEQADSIEGRVIGRFSTGAARDVAFASLDAAQKPGAICFVDTTAGWYGWNGGAWTRFGGELLTYVGRLAGTPQPTGILRLDFEFPFASGSLPRITGLTHKVTDPSNPPLLIRSYEPSGFLTNSMFHIHVVDLRTNAGYSNYLEGSYAASGLRPAGTA